jgi:hypothetical protein
MKEVRGKAVGCETVKDEAGEGVGDDDVGEECEEGGASEEGGARVMGASSNVLRCSFMCVCGGTEGRREDMYRERGPAGERERERERE